ncbi:phage tail tape measure protein [Paenibacillus sp. GCM10012307]|uniref:Phage tail tape measure protein n=1 Tax=Paenibacillus roseus TaxID=2798579 RepID=A0A934MPH9_9BACL|nr:phage tail tape measure protein [Paenibacillus roseus]MBJ6362096.1 phage tail tape measure protein [Paenibacillus roseus]
MSKEYEIAFKLGAQMESSFVRSFSDASKDFKELQRYVERMNKETGPANTTRPLRDDLKRTQKELQNMQQRADKVFSFIKRAGATVAGVFAVNKIVGAGKDIMQTFANFEQGMADVKAVSGASGKDFELLTAKAKEMGSATSKTATEAAEGLKYLALAGWNTEQVLAGIEPVLRLSEAGTMDLGLASDLATDSMAAMGIGVNELMPYLNMVAQTGRKANTSVQQLMEAFVIGGGVFKTFKVPLEESNALLGILANRGFKGTEAGTAMNAIVTNLTSGLGQAGTAMEDLKLSAFDSKGNFKGLERTFRDIKARLDPMTDAQKAQYIAMIAGKEHLKTFTGILDGLGNEYDALKKSVLNADGALMDMSKTQMDTYLGSLNLLKAAVDGFKISIGNKLAPTIRSTADQLTAYIPKVMNRFEKEYDAMTKSPVWKNTDWLGQIKIAWDRLISQPFDAWWQQSGKSEFVRIINTMGSTAKKLFGSMVNEAFSFNGTSSLLAAGALAIPAFKMGKGTLETTKSIAVLTKLLGGAEKGAGKAAKGLAKAGEAAGEAASGVGQAAKASRLFGPALSMMTSPVGLAIGGIGLLTAGVIAYKKHQEQARQSLINMGSSLQEASKHYKDVSEKSDFTKNLTREYRELYDAVRKNAGSAEELAEKQQRMRDIVVELQQLFPQTLTNYDIENGRIMERLGLLDQMSESEMALERLRLEGAVAEKRAQQPKLEKEIKSLEAQVVKREENVKSLVAERDAVDRAIPVMEQYEVQLRRIFELYAAEERTAKIENLLEKANELGSTVGLTFNNAGQILGASAGALDSKRQKLNEDLSKAVNKKMKSDDELRAAKSSYQELYDSQKKIIELDLGGTLEQQAKKFKDMSTEEQARFNQAVIKIDEVNKRMSQIPTDHKVNIQVIWSEIGGSIADAIRNPGFKVTAPSGIDEYAEGGFASKPSIFGEAGLEAAIPINDKPRSHAILEQTNRMMGYDRAEAASQMINSTTNHNAGDVQVHFNPTITVHGGGDSKDVDGKITQAMQRAKNEFVRDFKAMLQQEKRLSFR